MGGAFRYTEGGAKKPRRGQLVLVRRGRVKRRRSGGGPSRFGLGSIGREERRQQHLLMSYFTCRRRQQAGAAQREMGESEEQKADNPNPGWRKAGSNGRTSSRQRRSIHHHPSSSIISSLQRRHRPSTHPTRPAVASCPPTSRAPVAFPSPEPIVENCALALGRGLPPERNAKAMADVDCLSTHMPKERKTPSPTQPAAHTTPPHHHTTTPPHGDDRPTRGGLDIPPAHIFRLPYVFSGVELERCCYWLGTNRTLMHADAASIPPFRAE